MRLAATMKTMGTKMILRAPGEPVLEDAAESLWCVQFDLMPFELCSREQKDTGRSDRMTAVWDTKRRLASKLGLRAQDVSIVSEPRILAKVF